MSKRVFAALGLLAFIVTAGCARPFTAPQVPPGVPAADKDVHVIAKDRWILGCHLEIVPPVVNARRGQSIRWMLTVQDDCVPSNAPVKVVMKWKDCRGRPNSEEPLDLNAPGNGNQVGTVKAAATEGQCFQYGVFAGTLFKDPELIIDR
jgi:hypothetical protein